MKKFVKSGMPVNKEKSRHKQVTVRKFALIIGINNLKADYRNILRSETRLINFCKKVKEMKVLICSILRV